MFYSTAAIAVAAFSGLVAAQSTNETGTGPTIDAGSVAYATRQTWCRIQTQTCPQLCEDNRFESNNCDPNTLTYSCICASNSMSPNVSDYEQTLPAFVCREYVEQCVNAHPNDLDGITTCRDTVCGNKTIDEASSSSSSSSSASATGSSTRTSSGSGASETASSTSGGAAQTASESASSTADASAASALNIASNYGTGLLAVGILAAFGLAL